MARYIGWVLLCLFGSHAAAAERVYEGEVVSIADGDTIRVLYKGGQLKIRLAEIDTPEKKQPYGNRARQALAELVAGKVVRVVEQDRDRYGRIVGRVYVGDLDVNAALVRQGAAWVYRQYAKDQGLFRIEREARTAGRGLWSLPEAERVAPWEWRQQKRSKRTVSTVQPAAAVSGKCGAKQYCREMQSCAEAMHYLKVCGLTRLDGDGDGVPCEALCR